MSVNIRPMRGDDLPCALALTRAAHWNQIEADWRYFLHHGSCLVADFGNQLVGTCAVLHPQGPAAWIAMMLVHPGFRRQAIGNNLFQHILQLTSAPSIGLDATPEGRPLYEHHDFHPVAEIERWLRPPSPFPTPPGVAPCPWRPGHSAYQLGPLHAATPEEAIATASATIHPHPQQSWIVDVPAQSPQSWRNWLTSQHFVPQRSFTRMFRGPAQPIPPTLYATSGPEYGPNKPR